MKSKLLSLALICPPLLVHAQDAAPKPWAHESEASVVLVGGNSKTETYSAKQKTSYEAGAHKATLSGHYLMGKTSDTTNAENWSIGLRYDFAFSEEIGIFAGETVSGDRFKNIDTRYDSDLGLKYTFWKDSDKDYALGELGYRYSFYDYTVGTDDDTHFARAYLEASKGISEAVLAKVWVEFLPNLEDTEQFLVNFEPSLQFTLSQIFSIKTGYLGNYDSTPTAGKKKFDYTYTLALIAKY